VTRVWLVRHGATTRVAGVAIGFTDAPLSDQGVDQARRLARDLSGRPLARVWSSDLERAAATARAIAAPHGLAVETTPALREIDFGAWETRALSDLWEEDPGAAKAWEADFKATPPGFGESVVDLERRVERFWRSIVGSVADKEIAVVGHRGSLAALRALITGEPVADTFATGLALAEVTLAVAKA
jgi:broad specificity phosphatase PhoE